MSLFNIRKYHHYYPKVIRIRKHLSVSCCSRSRVCWHLRQPGPLRLSRLEIQQRSAALQIDRHRNLVVHDEPVAVDLPKARRRPKPEIGPVPVLQRAAYPIEAVAKCDIITHSDSEVMNLVTERMLVHRKGVCPVFPFRFCSHVLQRRYDVEWYDIWSVNWHDTLEIHGANCLSQLVDSLSNVGFVSRSLCSHHFLFCCLHPPSCLH